MATSRARTASQLVNVIVPMTPIAGGLVPTPPNDATKYLDGSGAFSVPAGSGGGSTDIAATIHAATSKATPVDADELGIVDSAASNVLKKLTWANLKATLAAWIGGGTLAGSFTTLTTLGNLVLRGSQAGTATAVVGFFKGSDNTIAGYWGFGGTGTPFELVNYRGSGYTFNDNGSQRVVIDTAGNVLVTTPALLGYGIGAGGAVSQLTSKSTAVTLNKPCGRITMNAAALGATSNVEFLLNNSLITDRDVINLCISNSSGPTHEYELRSYVGNGGVFIKVFNTSAGSLSEAVVINFIILRGAIS